MTTDHAANTLTGLLWAQANAWEQTVAQLRTNSVGMGDNLLKFALVFVFAVAGWYVIHNRLQRLRERTINDPRKLFRDLCRVQRLNWKDRALLRDLADRRGLETPSLFFVREDYFAGEEETADGKTRREVKALREKLFSEST